MKRASISTARIDIKKLENELELYNINIEMDDKDANSHYLKAGVLVKLAQHKVGIDSAGYYRQALECYDNAVSIDPKALYLIDRSKLHVTMGHPELAVADVKTASASGVSEGIAGIYIQNTIRDIGKLEAVQNAITKLESSGKIDSELADALKEHANVTANLVVQVGTHGEELIRQDVKLVEHDTRMDELAELVKQLKVGAELTAKQTADYISQLKSEIVILKAQTIENTRIISSHSEELQEHKELIDDLDERLNSFKTKLDAVNLEQLERVIEKSELQEAEQRELEIIEQDVCKAAFYNSVRWQMNSLYVASAAIATGMLENQKTGTTGKIGKVLDGVSGHIPFIGLGVQLIGEILQEVDKINEAAKIEKYIEIAVDNRDMAELTEKVARKLALKVGAPSNIGNDELSKFMLSLEDISEKLAAAYDMAEWAVSIAENGDSSSIAKMTASIYDKIKSKITVKAKQVKSGGSKGNMSSEEARHLLENELENPQVKKGETLAKIVVKELTKNIYQGEIELEGRPQQKADMLVGFITNFYENKYSDSAAGKLKQHGKHEQKVFFLTAIEYDNPEVINDLYQKYSDSSVNLVINDLIELLGSVQLSQADDMGD